MTKQFLLCVFGMLISSLYVVSLALQITLKSVPPLNLPSFLEEGKPAFQINHHNPENQPQGGHLVAVQTKETIGGIRVSSREVRSCTGSVGKLLGFANNPLRGFLQIHPHYAADFVLAAFGGVFLATSEKTFDTINLNC